MCFPKSIAEKSKIGREVCLISKEDFIRSFSKDLKQYADGSILINITQIAQALHISRDTARQYVYPLGYIQNGREKQFYVAEVAQIIWGLLQR